jgi:hypothetical protein
MASRSWGFFADDTIDEQSSNKFLRGKGLHLWKIPLAAGYFEVAA